MPYKTNLPRKPLFKVLQPGLQTTIQDCGRFGYQQFGLAPSGPLDESSAFWANWLLSNPNEAALLEIPLGQITLLALEATWISVTGADLTFCINRQAQPRYQALAIQPGDQLTWQAPTQGMRSYLAVLGGLDSPMHFGSRAVNLREGIGKALKMGQILSAPIGLSPPLVRKIPQSQLKATLSVSPNQCLKLRFLADAQWSDFGFQAQQSFLSQRYQLSSQSNRTGVRLIAQTGIDSPYQNMISEGIHYGAIQLPPHGQPIILLKERPTIGGYPKLGHVLSVDLDRLAQAQPNSTVQFQPISLIQAHHVLKRSATLPL